MPWVEPTCLSSAFAFNSDMNPRTGTLLLTPQEMAAADAAAARSGIDAYGLMEKAGQAVAAAALRLYPQTLRFVVLCGPGNNGGDGYVAARVLSSAGAVVETFALGNPEELREEAKTAFRTCPIRPRPMSQLTPRAGDAVIDAVFGAGLARAVPEELRRMIAAVEAAGVPVLAVDLPSGLCGRRGVSPWEPPSAPPTR
jgi:yjeF N-terminal region